MKGVVNSLQGHRHCCYLRKTSGAVRGVSHFTRFADLIDPPHLFPQQQYSIVGGVDCSSIVVLTISEDAE